MSAAILSLWLSGIPGGAGSASAADIVVNTGADGIDPLGCTLRRAIENHNSKGQSDIRCKAGTGDDIIRINTDVVRINLGDPLPGIDGRLTITKSSPVDGCQGLNEAAYLTVNPGASLTLTDIGISSNGSHNISVIDNNGGTLTINGTHKCSYTNNKKNGADSGGVIVNRNNGKVVIGSATFRDSHAISRGGAIYNQSGSISFDDSGSNAAFTSNSSFHGGAIYNDTGATLTVASNVFEFSKNEVGDIGGAIYNRGILIVKPGSGSPLHVKRLFADNRSLKGGGAIFSDNGGQLTVQGVEFKDNLATAGSGGAIVAFNQTTNISDSYFHNNRAQFYGGGVYISNQGTLNVSTSTFAHDRADQGGDGIHVDALSMLTVTNSTIIGGSERREGIILGSGDADIANCTLFSAFLGGQPLSLRNSLLRDVVCNNVLDDGFNLQFQSECPTSIPRLNPRSETHLGQNGGPTPTIALHKNSPAVNAISIPNCIDAANNRIATDQRGVARPAGSGCDIGAFELSPAP